MTALPGTPAIQNAIPMPYFGTTPFAAPGLIGGAVMGMLGAVWMLRRARQAAAAGEGYGLQLDGPALLDRSLRPNAQGEGRTWPNRVFSNQVLPRLDSSYLASVPYGATRLDAVRGAWAIIAALAMANLLLIGLGTAFGSS